MTNEEIEFALQYMRDNMPSWDYEANMYCAETCYGLGEYICSEPEGYVFKTAIEALEKQVPKKPGVIDGMRYCTACNTQTTKRILMGWEKCCPDCGQRIDWRQE